MRLMPLRPSILALAAALAGLAASPAEAAESYARLLNGEKFRGDVPADADIRLEFDVAGGAEPRLTFSMSYAGPTVTFRETHLYDPAGNEVLFDSDLLKLGFKKGVSSLTFKGYTATIGGTYQMLVKTNSHQLTHVTGRFTTARPAKVPIAGDETTGPPGNPVSLNMLAGDSVKISVARVGKTGALPKITTFTRPDVAIPVGDAFQDLTKKGAVYPGGKTYAFAGLTGTYSLTIGYQDGGTTGAWKGSLKIRSFAIKGGGFPKSLVLRNSPGVPLSVFDNDRTATPTWGGTGAGVATDGLSLLVTSESGGSLLGQLFDRELAPLASSLTPTTLAGAADMSTGETLAGHRVLSMGPGGYYAGFGTASGKGLAIAQLNGVLQRTSFAQVLSNSPVSTKDFFMAGDGTNVSLGVADAATRSHAVHVLQASNFGNRSTYSIGGAAFPQSPASGAAWRGSTEAVYELWSADTQAVQGPSDLHRVLYSATWNPTTTDARPVQDVGVTEQTPTAVAVDAATGATILHYVVPDNPPLVGAPAGSGRIHRRVFNATGVEIPGSHVVLPRMSCNRPQATIWGAYLYVAYETATGFVVERYQLLR
jgi:hypothetical protein